MYHHYHLEKLWRVPHLTASQALFWHSWQWTSVQNVSEYYRMSLKKPCTLTRGGCGLRDFKPSVCSRLLFNKTMSSSVGWLSRRSFQLTGINDKMAEYTSTPGVTSLNAALMHTLQRHRDILQVRPDPHLSLTHLTHSLRSPRTFSTLRSYFYYISIIFTWTKARKKTHLKVLEFPFFLFLTDLGSE